MPELLTTAESIQERDFNNQRFLAALKGINLDDNVGTKTFEDIQNEVWGERQGSDDIADLRGHAAAKEGFGIGMGLGYEMEGGD